MQGKAEFFAPLTETRPRKGRPPEILNLSIAEEINGKTQKSKGLVVDDSGNQTAVSRDYPSRLKIT